MTKVMRQIFTDKRCEIETATIPVWFLKVTAGGARGPQGFALQYRPSKGVSTMRSGLTRQMWSHSTFPDPAEALFKITCKREG
jgi:hypothetical protein